MLKHHKTNLLFIIFLLILLLISIFITYLLIINHNPNTISTKDYYQFKSVSKKETIDVFKNYYENPITINFNNKVSITGLKNKTIETKINNKLSTLDASKNEYNYNACNVNFNYSNVLSINCKDKNITVNLVNGNDILLEEIFNQDTDLLEISKDALYKSFCPWIGCEDNQELYNYDNNIDNYLISGIKDIKNRNYEISLYNTGFTLYLNDYNLDDTFGSISYNFYNYLNDITIYNRFLTNDNIYENKITTYCNISNCLSSAFNDPNYYSSSSYLNSNTYLNLNIYNTTSTDITGNYEYENISLNLKELETNIFNLLDTKYNLKTNNNYASIYIDINIYNTNYDYQIITYIINRREFTKENFIKHLLGYEGSSLIKNEYIFKNDLIIKDQKLTFLNTNPTEVIPDFNQKLYNYIINNEEDFANFTFICDAYPDYNTCLEEYNYEKLVEDASYSLDLENNLIYIFYESPVISGIVSYINTYLPLDLFLKDS